MLKLLIASNNSHKITEIKSVLKSVSSLQFYTLKDFGITKEVEETGNTLQENALLKAKGIFQVMNIPTIADDTGLFVDALNGDPGVYSARYAGENATYADNCVKLLSNLDGVKEKNRTAKFESVICFFVSDSEYYFFNGVCKGKIIDEQRGDKGFGYDPLFLPDDSKKTFAELSEEEKNEISHRALALMKFKEFIASYSK